MKTYVWCEDSGAGYEFWRYIFKVIRGDAKVESKGNNTELRKSVEHIGNEEAEYYVTMDMAVDNPDVLRELKHKILTLSKDLRFDELRKVLESYGYEMNAPKSGSSHYTFRKMGKNPITIPKHNRLRKYMLKWYELL